MNPLHYALVAGVSNYPGISDLDGPVNDAKAFHTWLVDPAGGGLPPTNVSTVLSDPAAPAPATPMDARPVKREFDAALYQLNKKAQAAIGSPIEQWQSSRLYVYVAGHGIMPGDGEAALLMADAERGRYGDNVELSAYLKWYRNCSVFQEVVVFADCCRNWFGQVSGTLPPFDKCPGPGAQVFTLVGYAAGPGSPAYEQVEEAVPPDDRRGYFTTALLEGLRGAAAIDPQLGCITSLTLAGYVGEAVRAATKDKPVPQQVEMPTNASWAIRFGDAPQRPRYAVTVSFPASLTAMVELQRDGGVREPRNPADGDWTLELPDGLYGLFPAGGHAPLANGMFAVAGGPVAVTL